MAGKQNRKRDASLVPASSPSARMPLWSRPGYLVRRLHQIHSALWAEECKPFNITPVQYGLMTALLYYPDSDQASLGLEVGIDRTNVADVLERLAERGLVQRTQGTRDRRTMLARLTPAGETLTKKMHASMQRAQERLLAPLPAGERARFIAQLTTLIEENETRPAATSVAPRLRSPARSRNR